MTDDTTSGTTARTTPKKGKKKNKGGGKWSAEALAKRAETIRRKKEEAVQLQPDVGGAIIALRAARREILRRVQKEEISDLGIVEINVFIALRSLQGK
jgi:hypothetical protein